MPFVSEREKRVRINELSVYSSARMLPFLLHIDALLPVFCACGGVHAPVLRRATVKYTYAARRMVRVGVVPSEDGS